MTTTNKGLIQPANGSYTDIWDQPVNTDWSYIDSAFGGVTSLNATGVSAATLTLAQYQPMAIAISGAMSNNVTYTIPSGVGGNWIVRNTTTDATGGPWTVTFASGGGGSTVAITRSVNSNIWSDGTNMYFSDSRPASAGGSNTQVQYNSSGTLTGSSQLTFAPSASYQLALTAPASTQGAQSISAASGYSAVLGLAGNGTTLGTTSFDILQLSNSNAYVYQRSAAALIFGTNNTERMTITSAGDVGIGTTSPGSKLSIVGNFDTTGTITATALIYSTSGGFKFPDGTTQTTAATGYTPPTSVGAVGTYALLAWNGSGSPHGYQVFPGDQISGGNLTYSETSVDGGYFAGVSGTWQCMGYCNNGYSPSGVPNNATLWLRVS